MNTNTEKISSLITNKLATTRKSDKYCLIND